MNNIDIANGLIFQKMNINNATFGQRLVSQKKIFLLQELGLKLGYSYNWYIHGPYSPDFTTYLYNNVDVLREQDFSQYSLSEDAQAMVDTVNALAQKEHGGLSGDSWYELLASVLYISKNWKTSKDETYKKLISYKPQFSDTQFNTAWDALQEKNFPLTVGA